MVLRLGRMTHPSSTTSVVMGADLQFDQLGIPAGAAHRAGEPLGYVVSVRGSQASVGLPPVSDASDDSRATVGKFLGVSTGKSLLIGVITDVSDRAVCDRARLPNDRAHRSGRKKSRRAEPRWRASSAASRNIRSSATRSS